jgi:hypothetical protein
MPGSGGYKASLTFEYLSVRSLKHGWPPCSLWLEEVNGE